MEFVELQLDMQKFLGMLQVATFAKIGQQAGSQVTAGVKQFTIQSARVGQLTQIPSVVQTESPVFHDVSGNIAADSIQGIAIKFSQPVTYHLLSGTEDAGSFALVLELVLRMDGGASVGPPPAQFTPAQITVNSAVQRRQRRGKRPGTRGGVAATAWFRRFDHPAFFQ